MKNHRKIQINPFGFGARDDGGLTILGLYFFIAVAMVAAAGLDVAYLFSSRSKLQVAADSTAHAALYYRETHTADDAKQMALDVGFAGMPEAAFGKVVRLEDVKFGHWDDDTQTFEEDPKSLDAVYVETARIAERENPVGSYLFRMIGINAFDVLAPAVFTTYKPLCFREGFVADDIVDIQSNNSYFNGFCIHSNTHVSLNSNNFFEPGTIVSMPDLSDLDLPNSGFKTNEGLEAALRSGTYRLRVLDQMPDIYDDLMDETDDGAGKNHVPDYITSDSVIRLNGKKLDETDIVRGRIHYLACGSNGKVTLTPTEPLREIVFVTGCEVKLSQNTQLEDVVLFTTNTGAKSVNSPSSAFIGREDDCVEGGGAQVLTYGGMNFASDLHLYGGQLLALGDIEFSANASGIKGASMVASGVIDGTSNMNMGFCLTGMEDNFEADYFRLAL